MPGPVTLPPKGNSTGGCFPRYSSFQLCRLAVHSKGIFNCLIVFKDLVTTVCCFETATINFEPPPPEILTGTIDSDTITLSFLLRCHLLPLFLSLSLCVCMCMCAYTRVCVHLCVCTCTYTHVSALAVVYVCAASRDGTELLRLADRRL